jgi:DNA (cytosine-5)-methyltransferase 1
MIKLNEQQKEALKDYNFIDLFCGIGAFHLALSAFGANCVFASDINVEAQRIYKANFNIEPKGDIKPIAENALEEIPKHDILCGGFPCQAFSISGKGHGFDDPKTGKLFFEIIKIAKAYQPKVILLENVANLEVHDNGKSLIKIKDELIGTGYVPYSKVLNAKDYGIPQYRRRIYIVCIRKDIDDGSYNFPTEIALKVRLENLLEYNPDAIAAYVIDREFNLRKAYHEIEKTCKKPYIRIGEIGKGRQGERIYSPKGCSTTLSASSGGLGGRTGMYYINNKNRKLTPRECGRLMGFPDSFVIAKTANQAYRQFGNSVVVDVLQYILIEIIKILKR